MCKLLNINQLHVLYSFSNSLDPRRLRNMIKYGNKENMSKLWFILNISRWKSHIIVASIYYKYILTQTLFVHHINVNG